MSRKINPQIEQNSACITSGQVALMALGTGSIIANLSYIQPLLTLVASTFGFSTAGAGIIAMVSQLGTALGMLRFVPLGDKERRSLIVRSLLAACVSLLAMATARSLWWLVVASFGVGPTTATVHIIVPLRRESGPRSAARQSSRHRDVGFAARILLARTVRGLLAACFGWRFPYLVAALLVLTIAALCPLRLPRSEPPANLTWPDLIRSTGRLIRTQPALVEASLIRASLFGAFSAFWTTLVFFLREPPYHYGSGALYLERWFI